MVVSVQSVISRKGGMPVGVENKMIMAVLAIGLMTSVLVLV